MSKLINILVFTLVIVLVFRITGLVGDSNTGFNFIDELDLTNPQNYEGSIIWTTLAKLSGLVIVGVAITAAIIGTAALDTLLYAGVGIFLLPTLFGLALDLVGIYTLVADKVSSTLATLIFAPLIFIVGFAIYDYIRNGS